MSFGISVGHIDRDRAISSPVENVLFKNIRVCVSIYRVCHYRNEGKSDPGVYPQGHCWQRQKCSHPSLLSACQATPGLLCPVLVPTNQKRCRQTGESPNEGHKDDLKAGEPVL